MLKSFALIITYSVLSIVGLSIPATAQEASLDQFKACTKIKDNDKRLACFDQAAKGFNFIQAQETLKKAEKAVTQLAKIENEAKKLEAEKLALIAADQKRIAEEQKRAVDEFGMPTHAGKLLPEITATIQKVRKGNAGSLMIYTDNGQIWRKRDKKSPGQLKAGDEIIIKRSIVGNFLMTMKKNRRTFRVSRFIKSK